MSEEIIMRKNKYELKSRSSSSAKKANTSRVATFKLFIDPEDASKKQKRIGKQFLISTKKIIIIPPKDITGEILTERKTKRLSTASITSLYKPYRNEVDFITDEIVEILRKKLADIRERQKKELNTKDELGVVLETSKDQLCNVVSELESRKEILKRIQYVNEKLKADSKILQSSINNVQDKINDIHKVHTDNIERIKQSISEVSNRKQEVVKEIQTHIEEAQQQEIQFLNEKSLYQRLIDDKAKEVLNAKSELRELGAKEDFRVRRFMSDRRSIDISAKRVKSLTQTKRINKGLKSILLEQ